MLPLRHPFGCLVTYVAPQVARATSITWEHAYSWAAQTSTSPYPMHVSGSTCMCPGLLPITASVISSPCFQRPAPSIHLNKSHVNTLLLVKRRLLCQSSSSRQSLPPGEAPQALSLPRPQHLYPGRPAPILHPGTRSAPAPGSKALSSQLCPQQMPF